MIVSVATGVAMARLEPKTQASATTLSNVISLVYFALYFRRSGEDIFSFAPKLVEVFIRDGATVSYGAAFLRILCLAIPIYSVTFVIIAVFQAVGRSIEPFALSVLHKGSCAILLLFLIRRLFGLQYILWATPVMETVALIAALILLRMLLRGQSRTTIKEVIR